MASCMHSLCCTLWLPGSCSMTSASSTGRCLQVRPAHMQIRPTAVPHNDSHCHNMGWVLTLHVNVDRQTDLHWHAMSGPIPYCGSDYHCEVLLLILLLIRAVVPLRPPEVAACGMAVLKYGMHCSVLDFCLVQLTQHNTPVHCYGSCMLIHAFTKTMIQHADNDNNNSEVDSITTTTMTSIAMVWKNDGKS